MKRIDVKGQAAVAFSNAKALALRLKHLQLSPLAAMLLAALSATTLATGLFALYAMLGPTGADDGPAAPEWKPPTLAIVPLDPPKPAGADVETLSRPIFSKARKPAPKSLMATAETNLSAAPQTLSVSAIVRNKKTKQAFFVSSDAPEGSWRKIGDTVDSWTIKAIEPKEVVLQNGEQTTKVKLYADPPPADAAAALAEPKPPPQAQPLPEPPPQAPPPPESQPQAESPSESPGDGGPAPKLMR
jgi:hypothetical protein